MPTSRDLDLLYEIGSLRHMPRGWLQHLATNCANDLEHTIRVVFIALLLARKEGVKNEELIIKMALVHDLAETRTSDHSYVQKVYVTTDEDRALHDILTGTALEDLLSIAQQYHKRQNIEAKIVKDADNLDVDLELKELEEQGHQLPKKWRGFRAQVRKKLYTASAKQVWKQIQTSDPANWHLKTNKWLRLPNAGR